MELKQLEREQTKIFIKPGRSDMRKGIEGLSLIVLETLGEGSLFDMDAVFMFCGRKKDRYKTLRWEKDGFSMTYKRIESGKLKWPKDDEQNSMMQLNEQQYRWLIEGLSIHQRGAVQKAKGGHSV